MEEYIHQFNTYNPEGLYLPGILNEFGTPFEENDKYFNRIWSISSEEISLVEQLFADNQISLENLPKDIKEWPAKGNPYFGYNITDDLAPFYDHDIDNIYDPLNGDLPNPIEENENFIPTKFILCVYHTVTQAPLQISQIKYTLDCTESDLQNSIFTRLKIDNKSLTDLVEFKLGIYKDFDLGCFEDDFVGSHQETNSVYAYNSDGADQDLCQGAALMPDNISAIHSMIFMSHSMHSCVPEYRISESIPFPSLPIEYHRVLNGTFADGTPMTYGESGFNPASTDVTKFIFSELPNDLTGWTMYDSDLYNFRDTRLIPSVDF